MNHCRLHSQTQRTRRLVFLISALLYARALPAQQAGPADARENRGTIGPVFDRQLKDHRFEGAAIVVVRGDQVLVAHGFGADCVKHSPVDPHATVFRAASVSKLFVTTAVLQLAERGELRLDEDVNQYFTRFQLRPEQLPRVTAATLLTHTSGIEGSWRPGAFARGSFAARRLLRAATSLHRAWPSANRCCGKAAPPGVAADTPQIWTPSKRKTPRADPIHNQPSVVWASALIWLGAPSFSLQAAW